MQDDDFEWDDAKAAANQVAHGVSFVDARRAFADAFAVSREDSRQNYGELRYVLLAMIDNRLLAIAYALREDRFRIISARLAEPREKRRYHEQNTID